MHKVKYVILMVDGEEYAIIFNSSITHNDFNRLKVSDGFNKWDRGDIVAGGFVNITAENNKVVVSVYGKSVSANVESRPEDVALIRQALCLPI